jgi:hypothetical protein
MSKPINLLDVKQALRDERFRKTLPATFNEDMQKFLQNPGCACNIPIYKKILSEAKEQLKNYFPNRLLSNLDDELKKMAENNFSVINCKVNELESVLRKLPPGRKQITAARYENEITVIVNELDILY